jgi:hypothetical protein
VELVGVSVVLGSPSDLGERSAGNGVTTIVDDGGCNKGEWEEGMEKM